MSGEQVGLRGGFFTLPSMGRETDSRQRSVFVSEESCRRAVNGSLLGFSWNLRVFRACFGHRAGSLSGIWGARLRHTSLLSRPAPCSFGRTRGALPARALENLEQAGTQGQKRINEYFRWSPRQPLPRIRCKTIRDVSTAAVRPRPGKS
jgi:hypothetical protein